jgi:hypothetical protein
MSSIFDSEHPRNNNSTSHKSDLSEGHGSKRSSDGTTSAPEAEMTYAS